MKGLRTNWAEWFALLLFSLCQGAAGQTPPACSGAPIVMDGSTPGRVSGNATIRISGGELSGDGHNLFHNFSCFNIPENSSAVFRNPAEDIRNVIARVTGSERSFISGNLATQLGPDRTGRANVYLLNPNGVLFNGNSSIDLNGLTVSTARTIGFGEGQNVTLGSTTDDLRNVTGDPVSFGNLDSLGTVQFDDARFIMTSGGDLLLIAKDVELVNGSQVTTEGAQVVVAGAGTGNTVTLDIRNRTQLPSISQPATGNVTLDGFSSISTNHEGGGRIVIRGGMLTLRNNNPNNAALNVADAGGSPGVGIDVEATQSLTLTRSQISTGSTFGGTASDIRISAPTILMDNDVAGINESAIQTEGRGGDIDINARELLIRDGSISTIVEGGGTGGAISIDTGLLTITDRSAILSLASTSSAGGDIRATVSGDLSIDGNGATRILPDGTLVPETVGIIAQTSGEGGGGSITVDVGGKLSLKNGGLIDSSTLSDGDSGKITVSAANLTIDGENFNFATGITGFTENLTSMAAGQGGDIEVNVPGSIKLLNGGEIDTSSFGFGDAGRISVGMTTPSESILIDKGSATRFTGIGSDTSGAGNAGEITLRTNALSIENGGLISTGVFFRPLFGGQGNPISSPPSSGRGGDIEVFANSLSLSGTSLVEDDGTSAVPNSAIFAGTQMGTSGAGGGITIKALDSIGGRPSLQLSNGAEIAASAEGSGAGGSVEIRYPEGRVLLDSDASISARSGELGGRAGSVTAEAKEIILRSNSSISSTNEAAPSLIVASDDAKNAGSVILLPGKLELLGSRLEVSSEGGDAGTISIDGARLQNIQNSEMVAEAHVNGGNILIRNSTALILDRSVMSANAETGDGGIIDITSNVFFSQNSMITADSEQGDDGIVEIDRAVTLTGTEGQLEISALDATDLIQPECTKRLDTEAGSFIRSGRGGCARLPGGYLPSVRLQLSQ
ncbi:filamentous hemagglutinin N-terminal domain-containing protein [Haloferula sp.]|uniref:two-partner secretion domain-containing protein n=1 Tax=Haloferula sp. TaxID=2497595 RepID=UPI00329D8DEE